MRADGKISHTLQRSKSGHPVLARRAGSYGRTVLDDGHGELALEWWQVAVAAGVTVLALGYLGKIAKAALEEAEQELKSEAL